MGETEVICSRKTHCYPVVEGIPVMTDEDALQADPHSDQQRTYFAAEFAEFAGTADTSSSRGARAIFGAFVVRASSTLTAVPCWTWESEPAS